MEHSTFSSLSSVDSRADYSGSRHHVMARGGSRRAIFDGAESRAGFLQLLRDLEPRFGVRVHGYALMGNHYHLLVSSHRGKLSAALQHVNGVHARRFNQRVQQDGPLFRGRFASRLVEDERYWVHLLAYVHLNPFKDGFAHDVSRLPWTSHERYLGRRPAGFVHVEEHLALLHGVDGYRYLIEAASGEDVPEPEGFSSAVARFPDTMAARSHPERGSDGLDGVLEGLPIRREDLRSGRQTLNLGALQWITWWLDLEIDLQRSELAVLTGVSASTVTRRIQAVEEGRAGPPPAWLDGRVDLSEWRASA